MIQMLDPNCGQVHHADRVFYHADKGYCSVEYNNLRADNVYALDAWVGTYL